MNELLGSFWKKVGVVVGVGGLLATFYSVPDLWQGSVSLPKIAIDLTIFVLLASWLVVAQVMKERNAARDALRNARIPPGVPANSPVMLGPVRAKSLEDMIDSGQVHVNKVALDEYGISCKVLGTGARLDAEITFTFKGRNVTDTPLVQMIMPVVGDFKVLFDTLKPQYFDLEHDKNRTQALLAHLSGPDGERKDIQMDFDESAIPAHEKFWVELKYMWPAFFTRVDDYLFLDMAPFEQAGLMVVELDLSQQRPGFVQSYSVGRDRHVEHHGKRDAANGIHRFERKQPKKDMFYALTVQW
jgi:hypothetical protein